MLDIKDDLKHSFLLARRYETMKGFYISVPSLNESDFDFQIISKEQMMNAITRGEETFYSINEETFLDLETAFEEGLEDFVYELGLNDLTDEEIKERIEIYIEEEENE